ncbi:MAG: polyprenyl synthetase family protein [Bdellovibrionaceae bacterium]|nr:polyprenyl synthetase family protein [Bdellovibrio sp.]
MNLHSEELSLTDKAQSFSKLFDQWLAEYLAAQPTKHHFVEKLWQSKGYSLKSGGKRFRPFLAALIYQLWDQDLNKIKNFCLALEMIHTYSLIHDDLPCMDNDDLRRGKPSNHKVFDEATALLAGDGLLTQAFGLLANDPFANASTCVELIKMTTSKVGSFGMVGGQVLDMNTLAKPTIENLELIHTMKTAFLIQCAAMGGAFLAKASVEELSAVEEFGLQLGLAFQIKDDLLDADEKDQSFKSYVSVLGLEKSNVELHRKSKLATLAIQSLKLKSDSLVQLIDYNLKRTS